MTRNNWEGKTIGDRYQIEELLGQGGMSSVYKAKDPNLKRVVAVKIIHPHLSYDEQFIKRFEEEATAIAQLRHPNIIQVFDFNQDDETYYMVMEYVPGETLQERLVRLGAESRRLPFDQVAQYTISVCDAADYAHARGMIHRDIKPANIMLDVYGKAILMDFGIAKIFGAEQHTATGAVIGTAKYMAPEQIRDEGIDQRADVYAIGVTLFEMLNGAPPYEAESAMTLMMKHLNDPIPDLHALQPDVPSDLVKVVEKALAKDRDQRYQNAKELSNALKLVLGRLNSGAPLEVATAGATVLESVPSPSDEYQAVPAVPYDSGIENAAVAGVTAGAAIGVTARVAADGTMQEGAPLPPSTQPMEVQEQQPEKGRNIALIAGGLALVVLLLCVTVGGVFAYNQFVNNDDTTASEQTAQALALLNGTEIVEQVGDTVEPTTTFTSPPPTETLPPTVTPTPTDTPTPTLSPTPTVPPGIPYVRINNIEADEGGNYLVEYEVFEFSEDLLLDGYHMTFFFDNLSPEEVGSPHKTPYYMYAGPSPFSKFSIWLRSEEADRICVLVTKPNHIVELESGNCFTLPEIGNDQNSDGTGIESLSTPTPTVTPVPTKEEKDDDDGY